MPEARRVLLVNVDCEWNLAIRRMWAYYESAGWDVDVIDLGFDFYHARTAVLDGSGYDMAAVSNIFDNNALAVEVAGCPDVRYGGIGSRNPEARLPPEIEATPPKYLDGEDTARGFITRGCVRRCWFCKVPAHEGGIRAYRDVSEVVGKFKKAVLMDNNLLAWDGHMDALGWLAENGVRCQFNQGLDIRLADEANLAALAALRYMGPYTFAFDDWAYLPVMERKVPLAKRFIPKPWDMRFFVYVSARMDPGETVARVEWLRERECLPYIMRDRDVRGSEHGPFYTDLASWCNQPAFFKKTGFGEFLDKRHPKNQERRERSLETYEGATRDLRPRVLKLRHTGTPNVGGGEGPMSQADLSYTLATGQDQTLFQAVPVKGDATPKLGEPGDPAYALRRGGDGGSHDAVAEGPDGAVDPNEWIVRGLTPIECERLQGFSDGHTDLTGCDADAIIARIPMPDDPKKRGQVERNVRRWCERTPDGPRYKAAGNSMAVPVIEWLGRRIEMVDGLVADLMMLKVKLTDGAPLPVRAKPGDAGLDLTSRVEAKLWPGQSALVPTGVSAEIPDTHVGLVFPRSGLASKHGITLRNAVGVIDSGYRGVIHAPLYNVGERPYTVDVGERVCQLVIVPCEAVECVEAEELGETERGGDGFGSTGGGAL